MAKNNAINNLTSTLRVNPGASGDSNIIFAIGAPNEFTIGVDDTDDSYRISQGGALGTNDTFIMTDAGERTMPLQPAFLGIQESVASNVTGNATAYTIGATVALTEVFDQGGDFTTAGVFTAPVTGRYYLCFVASYDATAGAGGATTIVGKITTSNKDYRVMTLPTENTVTSFAGDSGLLPVWGSVFCDMDAADTAFAVIIGAGGSGDNDEIHGDGTTAFTYFCGYLAC